MASNSVCIRWYGRQLITTISHLVPSKKQISGIGATSRIGDASSSNFLSVSVCLFLFLSFAMIPSPNSSNGTTEGKNQPQLCIGGCCSSVLEKVRPGDIFHPHNTRWAHALLIPPVPPDVFGAY